MNSKSEQIKEPTVEEAIEELRQMFPDESYGSIEGTFFDEIGMRVRIGLRDTNVHFNASSLSEAMDQVRAWHKAQELNTVLPQE